MRSFGTDLTNAIQNPERYGVVLLTFDMGGTIYGVWTGQYQTTYNSIVYRGGGSLIDVPDIDEGADGSISELTLSLSEAPDKGITVDVISSWFDEDWHMQNVTIEVGYRSPTTGLIIGTFVIFDGVMAQAPLRKGQGKYTLEVRCISGAYKATEAGGKYRNAQTQKLLDATDTSLKDIGVYGTPRQKELKWGQASG